MLTIGKQFFQTLEQRASWSAIVFSYSARNVGLHSRVGSSLRGCQRAAARRRAFERGKMPLLLLKARFRQTWPQNAHASTGGNARQARFGTAAGRAPRNTLCRSPAPSLRSALFLGGNGCKSALRKKFVKNFTKFLPESSNPCFIQIVGPNHVSNIVSCSGNGHR